MRKTKWIMPATLTGFGAIMFAIGGAAYASEADAPDAESAKALFSARCTGCHTLDTVTTQHGSDKQWRAVVERMIMNGAQLTDAETETIVAYLAKAQGPQS